MPTSTIPLLLESAQLRSREGAVGAGCGGSVNEELAALLGPRTSSAPTVLLLTSTRDGASDRVARRLVRAGVPTRRLNADAVNVGTSLTLRLGSGGGTLRSEEGQLRLSDVAAVWSRRRSGPMLPPGEQPTDAAEFAADETAQALDALPWALRHAVWFDPPAAVAAATSKLHQLAAAEEIGLEVPQTVITNRLEEAEALLESCSEGLVAKSFNWLFTASSGKSYVAYARRIRHGDRETLAAIAAAPCILQEEVPRVAEVRVFVVGRDLFSVRMTAESAYAPVDWRDPSAGVRLSACSLPDELAERLLKLVGVLGLSYVAIDLILRPDGRYVFLELNTHGHWIHFEDAVGVPVTAAIAKSLAAVVG